MILAVVLPMFVHWWRFGIGPDPNYFSNVVLRGDLLLVVATLSAAAVGRVVGSQNNVSVVLKASAVVCALAVCIVAAFSYGQAFPDKFACPPHVLKTLQRDTAFIFGASVLAGLFCVLTGD